MKTVDTSQRGILEGAQRKMEKALSSDNPPA
jgi:hypothetical protein